VALEREGLAAADRVVCVSRYTAGVVAARYGVDPARIRVVHNAVAQAPRGAARAAGNARRRGSAAPLVLFLGRVTAQKGPEAFLEAASRVAARDPRVRFVMAGSGDLLPRTIERAAEMGLARCVRFTGFLAGRDVARAWSMADVYVMPSRSEPFGIAPLEAAARGVPVVLSLRCGVREVLSSALTADPDDPEEVADRVMSVLRRPALRARLVRGARAEVRGMRWEARAAEVRALYRELVPA
jgi:glycosyltransferase involved in cell wall biosynthesis